MKIVFVVLILCSSIQARANEVSLIGDTAISSSPSGSVKDLPVINKQEELSENVYVEDEYQNIDDFINEENERMKDIKLLNLDLEKATLELKKIEIDQKIAQFTNAQGALAGSKMDHFEEYPALKVAAVFHAPYGKKAILDLNGRHISVIEGQDVDGFTVKTIKSESVVIQYGDGELQEFAIL